MGSEIPVVAVIQARMTSTRLPGKVLTPMAGAPALERMVERVSRARGIDHYIVATSTESSDDPIACLCGNLNVECTRGPLEDVLSRFVIAVPENYSGVVRLTGDCPLADPSLIDHHIDIFRARWPWAQYVTNAVERTQPDGLDVEVVSREILLAAHRNAESAFDREHVLPWVRRHARTVHITQKTDLSKLRWTLDTATDRDAIAAIFEALHSRSPEFSARQIYNLLVNNPGLIHVAGKTLLSEDEKASWVTRIKNHLDSEDSEYGAGSGTLQTGEEAYPGRHPASQ
jgi:spore coat polysaccharide biosynthesis protein SpsF